MSLRGNFLADKIKVSREKGVKKCGGSSVEDDAEKVGVSGMKGSFEVYCYLATAWDCVNSLLFSTRNLSLLRRVS